MLKIYLALPTYSNTVRRDFMLSLVAILMDSAGKKGIFPDVEFVIGSIGGDGVARARNSLTQDFLLNTDCTHILYLDVDIIFEPRHVRRLIDAQKPIVAGLYAAKQLAHRWIATDLPNELADPVTGLKRVQEAGTGIKLYERSVFEAMIGAFPEIAYLCDGSTDGVIKWDFFSMGVVNGRYLSEDYYCDYRARKIGFDVWVDTQCQVQHEGFIRYPYTSNVPVLDGMTIDHIYSLAEKLGSTTVHDAEGLRRAAA
jgi:hypothetical protein